MGPDAEPQRTVNVYDPVQNVWTTGPEIPGPRSHGFSPAACVTGGKLYVSTADGKVHRLNTQGDDWEEAGQLKQPRFVHRLVAGDGGVLIAVGGASKGGNVALTEGVTP